MIINLEFQVTYDNFDIIFMIYYQCVCIYIHALFFFIIIFFLNLCPTF